MLFFVRYWVWAWNEEGIILFSLTLFRMPLFAWTRLHLSFRIDFKCLFFLMKLWPPCAWHWRQAGESVGPGSVCDSWHLRSGWHWTIHSAFVPGSQASHLKSKVVFLSSLHPPSHLPKRPSTCVLLFIEWSLKVCFKCSFWL